MIIILTGNHSDPTYAYVSNPCPEPSNLPFLLHRNAYAPCPPLLTLPLHTSPLQLRPHLLLEVSSIPPHASGGIMDAFQTLIS